MNEIENMSYEEAMTELERLVNELEGGNLDLDKSLEIYERAIALRNRCKSILESYERKVQQLIETSEGTDKKDFTA